MNQREDGRIYFWIEAKFPDDQKMRMAAALWGPFNSREDAETEALQQVAAIPNATYQIHELATRDRNRVRGFLKSQNVHGGLATLPEVMHSRYRRKVMQ